MADNEHMKEIVAGMIDRDTLIRWTLEAKDSEIDKLGKDVEALHLALNSILTLFVQDHGWDYNCVDEALAALARNRDRLPIRVVLTEKIDELRNG